MESTLKNSLRLVLATLLFFTGIVWIRAMLIRRRAALVRVLLIHHIRTPAKFESMMQHLARNYHVVSYEDFCNGRFSKKQINILLTLDDGYFSWYQEGLPVLERYNIPALFFVASGFVRAGENTEVLESYCLDKLKLKKVATPLTVEALKHCASHPLITIGGHTVSHPFMESIDLDEAKTEVYEDKKDLENIIGYPPKAFAFPFGRGNYSDKLTEIIKGTGYKHAMTTNSDFYREGSDVYRIPRSNHGTVSKRVLSMWVWGAFDMVETMESTIRRFFVK